MRFLKLLIHLKSGLWFVPVLCVLAGVVLSFGTIALDRYFDYQAIPHSLVGGPDSATEILGTIAVSMVSLTALVLTITMVVVQLAMGQFVADRAADPPRQTRPARDRLFVATSCIRSSLREVTNNGDGTGNVPGIAVVTAFVLVLMSIAVLVMYVHHIRPGAARVGSGAARGPETRSLLDDVPDKGSADDVGDGVVSAAKSVSSPASASSSWSRKRAVPAAGSSSFPLSASSSLPVRPCFRVAGDAAGVDDDRLRQSLVFSLEPTLDEDVAYGVRLLVDIAERSLAESPFQDPTTAVQAIDRLHDLLRQLAQRRSRAAVTAATASMAQADGPDDELGGVRAPGLRRDPHGGCRLASGLAPAEGRARGSEVDRDARTYADHRRATRPARRRDGDSDGRSARRRLGAARGQGGIGAAVSAADPGSSIGRVKLLLVSLYWPPAGGGGVQRPLKFAQYLPTLGIETHVLAPDDPKWIHEDAELRQPTQAWVHRARYIGPKGRKPAEELHGKEGVGRALVQAKLASRRLLVPDENVSWNLTAIPAAIRIARRHEIDVVVTTSPPNSIHLVGAAVGKATGAKWVADLRDSLVAHPHRRAEPGRPREGEGRRGCGAARRPLRRRDHLRLRRDRRRGARLSPRGRVVTISNGCDFDDFAGLDYTPGSASGSPTPAASSASATRGRSDRARRVRPRRPGALPRRLPLRRPGVGGRTRSRRPARADPVRAAAGVARAPARLEALLLLIPDAGGRGKGVLSGKVFEYLAAERPILALRAPGRRRRRPDPRDGRRRRRAPDDVEAIKGALAELHSRFANEAAATDIPEETRHRAAPAPRSSRSSRSL